MADILKGAPVAAALTGEIKKRSDALRAKGVVPTLAVMRSGAREDDLAYERQIIKRCNEAGIEVRSLVFETSETEEFIKSFNEVNNDPGVHGILWFRPLPKGLDEETLRKALDPGKDVDGCTDGSLAGVFSGRETGFPPCTAEAVMKLLQFYEVDPAGKKAVILGRSMVIGRPVSMLLMQKNATVTICHTKTKEPEKISKEADILVCAVGHAGTVTPEYTNAAQTVIDVGINWDEEKGKLVGDVDFESVSPVVGAISPVPGGVGSVTTAVLCEHVVRSAEKTL